MRAVMIAYGWTQVLCLLVFAIQLDHFQYVVTVLTLTLLSLFLSIDLYLSWFGLLGFNASATARVISRRWNDDEISFLVEETGVPGGNHHLSCVHNIRVFGLYGKQKCKTWKISKRSTSNHDFIYFLRFHHASVTRNTLHTFHFPLFVFLSGYYKLA